MSRQKNQATVALSTRLLCASLMLALIASDGWAAPAPQGTTMSNPSQNLFAGLSLPLLQGGTLDQAALQGKVVLVVNVASQCGYTSQYAELQQLHERFSERGLMVIGVPCNQFGGQEPGSPEEIATFTRSRFQVSFPLLSKQEVNGARQSPLFQRLLAGTSGDVRWNFEKFLIGRSGRLLQRFSSGVAPDSGALVGAIEAALAAAP